MRGNPVLIGREHWAEALALDGDEGARVLLRRHGAVEVPCDGTGEPTDVDTPEDLAALERTMEIADSFRVSTPIDDTWKVLLDIEGIAPCLPGAQLQEVDGDEYRGIVKVKVGPITAQYKGTATLAEVDEANHRIVIDASGRDTRGQGNAKATIVVTMHDDGDGTKVDVVDRSLDHRQGRAVRARRARRRVGEADGPVRREPRTRRAHDRGGGDTSHAGGPYEQALESAVAAARGRTPRRRRGRRANGPRKIDSPEAEPVDLFEMAGGSMTKRLVPIGIGALVLFIALAGPASS